MIKGRLVEDLFAEKLPGDFRYWRLGGRTDDDDRPDGLNFWCPCGCGAFLGVSFEPGRWTWDGNREVPTVTPSILHTDDCRWHGYLTAGEFLTCGEDL